jgi:hypothetical protein
MKKARRRIDVNLEELDRVLDGAREAPLSESDHGKLRDALHALAELLVQTLKPKRSRITTRHRPLVTAAMEQRHLVVRGRLTSGTRR